MKRKLLTVEDRFLITRLGLVVVPGPLLPEFAGPVTLTAELWRPDGTSIEAPLSISYFFFVPPPKERRWVCRFQSLGKEDVPVGTEIWLEEGVPDQGQGGSDGDP